MELVCACGRDHKSCAVIDNLRDHLALVAQERTSWKYALLGLLTCEPHRSELLAFEAKARISALFGDLQMTLVKAEQDRDSFHSELLQARIENEQLIKILAAKESCQVKELP